MSNIQILYRVKFNEREKQKPCMFRQGHIYLLNFQENILRLVDTDIQKMELGRSIRQIAAWGTEMPEGINVQEKRV